MLLSLLFSSKYVNQLDRFLFRLLFLCCTSGTKEFDEVVTAEHGFDVNVEEEAVGSAILDEQNIFLRQS